MELSEVRTKKQDLERGVRELLQRFESETEACVMDLDLFRNVSVGKPPRIAYVEISIGI